MGLPVPRKPHDTRSTGGVTTLASNNDTMMLTNGDQRVWFQGGKVYDEAGVELEGDKIPAWVQDEYKKTTQVSKDTHPIDGSQPSGPASRSRAAEIDDLRRRLADLERDEINATAGARVGEGERQDKSGRPLDETDEEALNAMTKDQLLSQAQDEELEGITLSMKKDEMVAAILRARAEKAQEGSGSGDEEE